MNALIIVVLVVAVRVVARYFGAMSDSSAGELYVSVSSVLVLPIGLPEVRSLYGGVFDADAATTVIICLVLEWVLSMWRSRLQGTGTH